MEKGDKEIRTSYLTSMDVWFAAMKAFTALSLVESLVVLALIKRSRAMVSTPVGKKVVYVVLWSQILGRLSCQALMTAELCFVMRSKNKLCHTRT